MKKIIIMLFLAMFSLSFSASAEDLSLEPDDKDLDKESKSSEEDLQKWSTIYKTSFGEVSKIDPEERTMVLLSYDEKENREVEITYRIKEDVELEGLKDLNEIKAGALIDLDFHTDENGEKVIDFIAVLEVEP